AAVTKPAAGSAAKAKKGSKSMEDGQTAGPTFADAVAIVGLCAVAGFPASQALTYLNADGVTVESARTQVLAAQVKAGGEDINSHIEPNAGGQAGSNVMESPLVKAAQKLAAAAKRGGN